MKGIIFILVFLIISCNENSKNSKRLYDAVQGDWLYHNYQTNFFLSVNDSLLFNGEHIKNFEKFIIVRDTIKLTESKYFFHFSKVSPKYLRITNKEGKEIPLFVSSKIFNNTGILFKGVEIRFFQDYKGLLDWGIIIDKEKKCFIKINYTKSNKYINNPFADFEIGNYKSSFNESDFNFYQKKFQNVPLDSLQNLYVSPNFSYGGSCVGPIDIGIVFIDLYYSYTNDSSIRTKRIICKGYDSIPPYLGIFINYLNKIDNFVKFKRDTVLSPQFKFYSQEFIESNEDIFHTYKK